MTLTETEETLQTLIDRHPGLDDSMLVTLLSAGGWEAKEIETVRVLLKEKNKGPAEEVVAHKNLPILPEVLDLPAEIQPDHLLVSLNPPVHEELITSPVVEHTPEPQSLTQSTEVVVGARRDELPHDLPLRPFETSDHIWPFSRYKDVFYGEAESEKQETKPTLPVVIAKEVVLPVEIKAAPAPVIREVPAPTPVSKQEPLPLDSGTGEDKLVLVASVMLLAVLLILGYMYSNGRL
ncbi:MAG: hypothetical protein ACAH17_00025 [Candidatus Paceibacterota bacterium]